jgi:large subunit ribosomal protein L3
LGVALVSNCAEDASLKVLLGSKVGMTQVCGAQGAFSAVTVVHAGPCEVLSVRTELKHGYSALQLGYGDRPGEFSTEGGKQPKTTSRHKRFVREVPLSGERQVGDQLSVDVFSGVQKVDVIGVSKGRGFAGVIKRHHFGGVCASHGVKKVHRSGGSTGQSTDPGRVFKGTKMPGRLGGTRVTVKSLRLFGLVPQENLLLISGAVPGFNGGNVIVRESI